jgi:hypothetical protein
MRYLYKKTATYKNIKMLGGSAKPTFHLFKTPRVRIDPTRIRLIATHATLIHATFSNRGTARLKKKKANYSDRLASNSRSHNIEENIKNRVFAGEANEES